MDGLRPYPRPNKLRKRKRFTSKPFKFAPFVSPLPQKVCCAILFEDPIYETPFKSTGAGVPAAVYPKSSTILKFSEKLIKKCGIIPLLYQDGG